MRAISTPISILSVSFLLLVSCSPFSIKTEITKKSELSKLKRCGVILRTSDSSIITRDEIYTNITYYYAGTRPVRELVLNKDGSEQLLTYKGVSDRFYQLSMKNKFLKYKSIGVIREYLKANSAEIKKMMLEKNLDGLIIYEIDGYFSWELLFIDFNSLVTVVDKDFNILYIDQQSDIEKNIVDSDKDKVKKSLLDKVSARLMITLYDIGFVKKN